MKYIYLISFHCDSLILSNVTFFPPTDGKGYSNQTLKDVSHIPLELKLVVQVQLHSKFNNREKTEVLSSSLVSIEYNQGCVWMVIKD